MSAKEVEIMLTPSDIPGADPSEPFDKHAVSQLRWWLLESGEKITAALYLDFYIQYTYVQAF